MIEIHRSLKHADAVGEGHQLIERIQKTLHALRPMATTALEEDTNPSETRPIPKTLNPVLTPLACLLAKEAQHDRNAKEVILDQVMGLKRLL